MELQQLIEQAQQGDEHAFQEICLRFAGLVKKYGKQPHLIALGEEAEAEAWLAVVRAVKTFKPDAGVQPAGYIDSQVRYAVWNLFKRERRRWQTETAAEYGGDEEGITLLDVMATADNTELAVEWKMIAGELQAALLELPQRQSQAVILTLVQRRRLTEAGDAPGCIQFAAARVNAFEKVVRRIILSFVCHTFDIYMV